ncbi:MAG TPA: hypothetical protein VHX38_30090 [Pseudonocardiaceae bacterium]|jgi:hypothetical protein|nr:hypothetical protein [Pseudonocardiaceae bacterium]
MAVLLLVLCTGAVLLWWQHVITPWGASGKCQAYGPLYDSLGPGSIGSLAQASKGIVIGSVLNPSIFAGVQHVDGPPARIRVTDVLKGAPVLSNGDILSLCPGIGAMQLPSESNPTVLLFLEGKDGSYWVPTQGTFGIVPQRKGGTYAPTWVTSGPRSVLVPGLEGMIKGNVNE